MYRSALFASFCDICIYLTIAFVAINLKNVIRDREIFMPSTPHTIKISFLVFMITWLATYIACKMGISTIVNGWDKPSKPWGRVPGTLVVASITSLLAFIILLFAGQIYG